MPISLVFPVLHFLQRMHTLQYFDLLHFLVDSESILFIFHLLPHCSISPVYPWGKHTKNIFDAIQVSRRVLSSRCFLFVCRLSCIICNIHAVAVGCSVCWPFYCYYLHEALFVVVHSRNYTTVMGQFLFLTLSG